MSLVSVTDTLGSSLTSAISQSQMGSGGGGVDVDFDLTIVGQIVLFLILLVVLKPMLFDPMLRLFEERERRIDGAKLLARKIDEKSASALTTYENEMAKARAAANSERDKLRAEGLKKESEILDAVRATTAKTMDEARKRMAQEVTRARTALQGDGATMAKELATRVLGREVH